MIHICKPLTVTLWVTGMLAVAGLPATVWADAGAGGLVALANGPNGGMGCNNGEAVQSAAGTLSKTCQGAGAAYIGTNIGGIAAVTGANVVGPSQVNGLVVTPGAIGAAIGS